MFFKGRTVFLFIIFAIISSSWLTSGYLKSSVARPPSEGGLTSKDIDRLNESFINSQVNSSMDHDQMLNAAIKGMLTTLEDPFSTYKNPQEVKLLQKSKPFLKNTVSGEMVSTDIGKIEIRQFSQHTEEEFREELAHLENSGLKGLIIDVRENPGGYIHAAIPIIELFVEKGKTIIQTEDRQGKRSMIVSAQQGPVRKYPLVVLMNKDSASAAEMLAAALKQSVGCKLIGETTYGKGTIQDSFGQYFTDGSNLTLTINKWLTPNGDWLQDQGIQPDVTVPEADSVVQSDNNDEPLKVAIRELQNQL